MIQTVCDKCKKVIEGNYVELKQRSSFVDIPDINFHLCTKCHDEFEKFLANKT